MFQSYLKSSLFDLFSIALLLVLVTLCTILFGNSLRNGLLKGGWLGFDSELFRIVNNHGWLNREVTDSLLVLVAMTDVNLVPRFVLVEGVRTGPLQGADNNGTVTSNGSWLLFVSVGRGVAIKADNPGTLVDLFSQSDRLVLRDRLEAVFEGVSLLNLFLLNFDIVVFIGFRRLFGLSMGSTAVLEDVEILVNPHLGLAHTVCGRELNLTFFRSVVLNFTSVFFTDFHQARGNQSN